MSSWFKDYVYFPIIVSSGYKNQVVKLKKNQGAFASKAFATILPLGVVWVLTGIWHGTGWNYILWGAYYGAIMITTALFGDKYKKLGDLLHIDMTTVDSNFTYASERGLSF